MRRHFLFWFLGPLLALAGIAPFLLARQTAAKPATPSNVSLAYPGESHLANIRQLTFGGQSAEAYFSADDKTLIFQHQGRFYDPRTHVPAGADVPCDQMYTMAVPAPGASAQTAATPVRIS